MLGLVIHSGGALPAPAGLSEEPFAISQGSAWGSLAIAPQAAVTLPPLCSIMLSIFTDAPSSAAAPVLFSPFFNFLQINEIRVTG